MLWVALTACAALVSARLQYKSHPSRNRSLPTSTNGDPWSPVVGDTEGVPEVTAGPSAIPNGLSGRRSHNLVENLRRQLMQDNYDYTNKDSEERRSRTRPTKVTSLTSDMPQVSISRLIPTFTTTPPTTELQPLSVTAITPKVTVRRILTSHANRPVRTSYTPIITQMQVAHVSMPVYAMGEAKQQFRAFDEAPDLNKKDELDVSQKEDVSAKDLLYYVDDERMRRNNIVSSSDLPLPDIYDRVEDNVLEQSMANTTLPIYDTRQNILQDEVLYNNTDSNHHDDYGGENFYNDGRRRNRHDGKHRRHHRSRSRKTTRKQPNKDDSSRWVGEDHPKSLGSEADEEDTLYRDQFTTQANQDDYQEPTEIIDTTEATHSTSVDQQSVTEKKPHSDKKHRQNSQHSDRRGIKQTSKHNEKQTTRHHSKHSEKRDEQQNNQRNSKKRSRHKSPDAEKQRTKQKSLRNDKKNNRQESKHTENPAKTVKKQLKGKNQNRHNKQDSETSSQQNDEDVLLDKKLRHGVYHGDKVDENNEIQNDKQNEVGNDKDPDEEQSELLDDEKEDIRDAIKEQIQGSDFDQSSDEEGDSTQTGDFRRRNKDDKNNDDGDFLENNQTRGNARERRENRPQQPQKLNNDQQKGHNTAQTTTASVKYKLIKVRAGGSRRSGGGGVRQLLQERGPDGVELIALDEAPLPQFRLPSGRRQYMHDHSDKRPPLSELAAPGGHSRKRYAARRKHH